MEVRMGKNNKKNKSRSVVRSKKSEAKKKASVSRSSLEKRAAKERKRAELRALREKERSEYLIIHSDEERPEVKSVKKTVVKTVSVPVTVEDKLEASLKRISLSEIERYAKTSAKAYDKAYDEIEAYEKALEEAESSIALIKTPRGASEEEKAQNAEKRKALRAQKNDISKRIVISKANAEALERSSDEYAHIVALLKEEAEVELKKKPRLNPKKVDLTKEEENELVERYLQTKKPKTKKESTVKTEEVVVTEESAGPEVKTLKVLGDKKKEPSAPNEAKDEKKPASKVVEPKKEVPAKTEEKKKKKGWIDWVLVVVLVIIIAVFNKTCTSKDKAQNEDVNTSTAPVATVAKETPAPVVSESTPKATEEVKTTTPEVSKATTPEVSVKSETIETKSEPVSVETPKEDKETISLYGYSAELVYGDDSVTVALPSGVASKEDISSFFEFVVEKYPELKAASYSIDGDKVTLSASKELIASLRPNIKNILSEEIEDYLKEVSACKEEYNFYGYDVEIKAYDDAVVVKYPSVVTDADIADFAQYALTKYPWLKDQVSYTLRDGYAEFNLSFKLTKEEKKSVPSLVSDEIISYLSTLFESVPAAETKSTEISATKSASSSINLIAEIARPEEEKKAETVPVVKEEKPAKSKKEEVVAVAKKEEPKETMAVKTIQKPEAKERYNSFKASVALNSSALYLLNSPATLKDPAVYQNYSVALNLDNILKLGSKVGIGVKAEGGLFAIPLNGDYMSVNTATKFFNGDNWIRSYSVGADTVFKVNGKSVDGYASVGAGYVFSTSSLDNELGFNTLYIDAGLGLDFKLSKNFAVGVFGNYKNMAKGTKNYVGGGLSLELSF